MKLNENNSHIIELEMKTVVLTLKYMKLYQIRDKNMTKKMRNLKKDSHQRKDGIMSVNQASILMLQ